MEDGSLVVHVKFVSSRSNRSRDIRPAHFSQTMNKRRITEPMSKSAKAYAFRLNNGDLLSIGEPFAMFSTSVHIGKDRLEIIICINCFSSLATTVKRLRVSSCKPIVHHISTDGHN